MAEKIRLKGQLKLPVVGKNPTFAQMKFVKVALSEQDILPDSGSIFTCDDDGSYDFEIYTGKHLLSYNAGNSWSKPVEIIADPLADGLESIEISDLIGFQEIPELDATIAALNQQKQELLAIQQDVQSNQITAQQNADKAEAAKSAAELAAASDYAVAFEHYVTLPSKVTIPALGLSDSEVAAYTYDTAEKYSPTNTSGDNCYVDIPEFNFVFNDLEKPAGLTAYIVFFANVQGLTSAAQDSATFVNLLRYQYAISQFVAIKSNAGSNAMQVLAKNWEDRYIDRNELPVDYPGDEYRETFNYGAGVLRVLNLGEKTLEIFGVGLVIKK